MARVDAGQHNAAMPQPVVLPRGFTQLGAFVQGPGSSWQTLVARVEDGLASPAPKALPAGSRCILKRRQCPGIGAAEQLVRSARDSVSSVKPYTQDTMRRDAKALRARIVEEAETAAAAGLELRVLCCGLCAELLVQLAFRADQML